jgi:hypothetical protein
MDIKIIARLDNPEGPLDAVYLYSNNAGSAIGG